MLDFYLKKLNEREMDDDPAHLEKKERENRNKK